MLGPRGFCPARNTREGEEIPWGGGGEESELVHGDFHDSFSNKYHGTGQQHAAEVQLHAELKYK